MRRCSRWTRATWSAAGRSCSNDGDYLLPIYHETGHDPEMVGPDSTSLFLRFNPAKKTWTKTGRDPLAEGNIQPAVVQLDDGELIAYCRRGGDYDPKTVGYIVRSESHDGGRTWSEGKDSAFPNPNAAVDFLKLQERPAAPDLQRQHEPPHAADGRALLGPGSHLADPPRTSARATATSAIRSPSRPATAASTSSSPRTAGRSSTTRSSTKIGSCRVVRSDQPVLDLPQYHPPKRAVSLADGRNGFVRRES